MSATYQIILAYSVVGVSLYLLYMIGVVAAMPGIP